MLAPRRKMFTTPNFCCYELCRYQYQRFYNSWTGVTLPSAASGPLIQLLLERHLLCTFTLAPPFISPSLLNISSERRHVVYAVYEVNPLP